MASRKDAGTENAEETRGTGIIAGPFSSSLSSLFLLHRTLGSSDEAASEAEQYDKVLAYFPGKHSMTRQLELTSFIEGLIDFTSRFGEKENEAIQIVNMKKRCICFYPCEPPDLWLVAVLREPTGLAGDGSDRFSVNGAAVRTLLDLMYRGFVLFHGPIQEALASPTEGGPEELERVKGLRKLIRKNEAKRSLLEGGYSDDDDDDDRSAEEPRGEEGEPTKGNGSLEAKLAALDVARAGLESDLAEALQRSPATRLKRQLQAFLQVYLCGIDFENLHLFENLPAFNVAPADPSLFRKVHGLRHAIADLLSPSALRLSGVGVVLDGQLVGHSGLSQDEMLLIYTHFKMRDFAGLTQPSLPTLPGSSASSLPAGGDTVGTSSATPVDGGLDPPQTVAGAFESHRRKTSGIMGRLSGLAQRLKAASNSSSSGEAEARAEDEGGAGDPPRARGGFLGEDGMRYQYSSSSAKGVAAGPRLWFPKLHPLGRAAEGEEEARPARRVAAYTSERLLVLVVVRDEGLEDGTGLDDRLLTAIAAEIESTLGGQSASHVPPTERLGSAAPPASTTTASSSSSSSSASAPSVDLSRFIYHDRITRSLFTSHPAKSVPALQVWPPPSLFLCKHRSSVLSPLVLSVLDDLNLQLREVAWGDRDGQEGPFRELSIRTREDGWIVARQSCGREVYAMLDPRLTSILDAQEAMDTLLHHCFARVHVP